MIRNPLFSLVVLKISSIDPVSQLGVLRGIHDKLINRFIKLRMNIFIIFISITEERQTHFVLSNLQNPYIFVRSSVLNLN